MSVKLTIITINWNNRDGLEATIKSITEQSFKDFEYVIIDGDSSDGSKSVISRYDSLITKWVSEPDNGIYNAMNKGIALAHGDYLLFINSGDSLHNINTIQLFIDYIQRNQPTLDTTIIGRVNVISKDGSIISTRGFDIDNLTPYKMMLSSIPHQAAFIPRQLLIDMPYDESLKIAADWKFFLEALVIKRFPVKTMPLIVTDYDGTGISSSNYSSLVEEKKKSLYDLMPTYVLQDYIAAMETLGDYYHIRWVYRHPWIKKVFRLIASLGTRIYK